MDDMRPDQSIEVTMDRIEREAKRAAQAKAEQARFGDTVDGRLGPAAEAEALAARAASSAGSGIWAAAVMGALLILTGPGWVRRSWRRQGGWLADHHPSKPHRWPV